MPAWSKPGRGNRHQQGYGNAWDKLRLRVLRRDNYLCQNCLKTDRATIAKDVDHRVPKAKGGSDAMENLQSLCRTCHTTKTIEDSGGIPKRATGLDGWPADE